MWKYSIRGSVCTTRRACASISHRASAAAVPPRILVLNNWQVVRRSSCSSGSACDTKNTTHIAQCKERNERNTSTSNGTCESASSSHSPHSSSDASSSATASILSQLRSGTFSLTAALTPTILCSITNEVARTKHTRAWMNLAQSVWHPLLHSLQPSSISLSNSSVFFTSHLIQGTFEQEHIKQLIQACAKYRDNKLLTQIYDTVIKPQLPFHRYAQGVSSNATCSASTTHAGELPTETCSQELFDSLCQLLKAMVAVREFSTAFAIYGNLWQVIEYNRLYHNRQLQLQIEGSWTRGVSVPTPVFRVSSMPIEDIFQLLQRPKVGGGLKDEHELVVHLYTALKEEHFNSVMEWVLARQRQKAVTKSNNFTPPPPSPISTPIASIVLESLFRSSQSGHRHIIEQLSLLAHAQNQQIKKWKSEFGVKSVTVKNTTSEDSKVVYSEAQQPNDSEGSASSISASEDHAEELFPLSKMNYAPFHMITSISRISPNFNEATTGHIPAFTGSNSPSFTSKHDLWSDTRLRPIAKLKLLKFAVESVLIDQLRWNPSLNAPFMPSRQTNSSSGSDPFPSVGELSLTHKFMLPIEFYHVLIRGFLFQGQGALHYASSWFRYLYNRSIDASQGAQFLHGLEHETKQVSQQLRELQKSRNEEDDEEEEEYMDEDCDYEELCRREISKLELHPDTWRYAFHLFLRKSAGYSHSLNQQNSVRSPNDESSEYRVSTYTLSPYLLLRHLLASKFTHSFLKLRTHQAVEESSPKLNPLDWYPFWSHLERVRNELSRDLYECSVHQLPLSQRQAIYSDRLRGHSLSSMAGNVQNVTHPNVRLLKTAQQMYVDLEAEYMEAIAKMFVSHRYLTIVPIRHSNQQERRTSNLSNVSSPFHDLSTAMVFNFPSSLFPTPYSASGRASLAEYLRLVFRVVQSSLKGAKLQPQDMCLLFDFNYDQDVVASSENGSASAPSSALLSNGTAMRSVREHRWKESMRNEVKNALYQQFLLEPILLPRLPSITETKVAFPARVESQLSFPLFLVPASALLKWASKDFVSFLTPAVLEISPPNSQEILNRKQRLKPIRIYRDSNPRHQVQESNLPNTYVSNTYYLRIGSHFMRKHFHVVSTFDGTSDLQAQASEWKKILRQLKVEGEEIV